jgi:tetratricopeptide (TPR) repeat protein
MRLAWSIYAALSSVMLGSLVSAQTYVQQGHLLDASHQRGSAGLNPPRAQTYGQYGNQIVTGHVTGGRSFAGFSPIRDPNSLFISSPEARSVGVSLTTSSSGLLPSDSLSNFRRDSYGISDARQGYLGFNSRPYYSPSSVVNTGGIIRGLNSPGSSLVLTPYTQPRVDLAQPSDGRLLSNRIERSGTMLRLPAEMTKIDDGHLASGRMNPSVAGSALFGQVGRVSANELSDRAEREIQGDQVVLPLHMRFEPRPVDARWSPRPMNQREETLPVDNLTDPDVLAAPDRLSAESISQARIENRVQNRIQERITPDQFRSLTRAEDVFDQMQWTTSQIQRSGAGMARVPGEAPAPTGELAGAGGLARPIAGAGAAPGGEATGEAGMTLEERSALAQEVMSEPLRTFVGTQGSAINIYLARAEELMKEGQYYRASRVYDLARAVDFQNPLPLIGRSMALLAAGDYVSSSRSLFQAISEFEQLSRFRIDLTAFVPDITAMDRRRADMERRLEDSDNFDLRFLLGWAEYCSGMEERGLENMNRALQIAPPEEAELLTGFLEDLRQQHSGAEPVEIDSPAEPGQ